MPELPSIARVQVLDAVQRAQLAGKRDRLRRRGWIALGCAPLSLAPVMIAVLTFDRVPSDRDIVIASLATAFGILGVLPICLKIGLDALTASRHIARYLNDGIAPEPRRVRRTSKWAHGAAVAISLLHNPVAVFRGEERCFGDYATRGGSSR